MLPFHLWYLPKSEYISPWMALNQPQNSFQRSLRKLNILKKCVPVLQIYIQHSLVSHVVISRYSSASELVIHSTCCILTWTKMFQHSVLAWGFRVLARTCESQYCPARGNAASFATCQLCRSQEFQGAVTVSAEVPLTLPLLPLIRGCYEQIGSRGKLRKPHRCYLFFISSQGKDFADYWGLVKFYFILYFLNSWQDA